MEGEKLAYSKVYLTKLVEVITHTTGLEETEQSVAAQLIRARMLVEAMVSDKWTVENFEKVLKIFYRTHSRTTWTPADFFKIYYNEINEGKYIDPVYKSEARISK